MRRTAQRLVVTAVSVFALVACSGGETSPPPISPAARSESILDEFFVEGEPGCSVAVGVEGNVVWHGARGVADVRTGVLITNETVFHIASVTKQFTALAILLLEQDGQLATSDDLSKHVKGLPSWSERITLAHLMHHTSGIPDYGGLLELDGVGGEDRVTHAVSFRSLAAVEELDFEPGSTWEYSNSNYLLLAEVVRSASGEQLPDYLRERVFGPLSLDMVLDSLAAPAEKAVPYRRTADGFVLNKEWLRWELIGSAGIQTTTSELVRWGDNYRTGGVGGPRLLEAQLQGGAPMTLGNDDAEAEDEPSLYVAGIILTPEGHLIHGGSAGAFRTWFGVHADRRTSLAIACNIDELNMDDFALRLGEVWATWAA